MEALTGVGATIYGTDVNETIIVETDGVSYQVITERGIGEQSVAATPIPLLSSPTLPYDPNGRDRDCGSFATHAEAQAFFNAAGGPERDPHRLDGDDDSIARGAAMKGNEMKQQAVVDRIEGAVAVLMIEGKPLDVPVAQLPAGIREGDYLQVELEGKMVIAYVRDDTGTETARQRIADKLARLRRGDHLVDDDTP